MACPASTVLPRGEDTQSPAARFGTELHAWKAGAEPTETVAKWLSHQDPGLREVLWPGGRHEVLLGYKPPRYTMAYSGTKEENAVERAKLSDDWVAGEADWITEFPVPWVDDLKTGQYPGDPDTLPQLKFYAWILALESGEPEILVSITHWPRYPLGTPPCRVTRILSSADLASWARGLERPATFPALPGPHCHYCRCRCEHNPHDAYRPLP